jgi:hypothetical protein
MKTQKRFTPALLRRWHEKLRGEGTFDTYTAWHQITRGDPSSRGRSTIEFWPGSAALVDLLSNREQVVFLFCTMLSDAWEIRAQFPLAQNPSQHELAAYSHKYLHLTLPGTVQIAAELGTKHPVVRQGEDEELWVFTTDLLVTCRSRAGTLKLIAVSIKDSSELASRSKMRRLRIEREYWLRRGVEWLLITERQYQHEVGEFLRRNSVWALSRDQVPADFLKRCAAVVRAKSGNTLTDVLNSVSAELNLDIRTAQLALWQSVWKGAIPIDLRIGWRPSERIAIVSDRLFGSFNPIHEKRSEWQT